jgi:hypothetical protein
MLPRGDPAGDEHEIPADSATLRMAERANTRAQLYANSTHLHGIYGRESQHGPSNEQPLVAAPFPSTHSLAAMTDQRI